MPKIIFKSVYITLATIGLLLSTHIFTEHTFSRDFYLYYTNITNFLCLCFMLFSLIWQCKKYKQNQPLSFSSKKQKIIDSTKFVLAILIFITFFVYNTFLADYSLDGYFFNLYNLLFHIILPILFVYYSMFSENVSWLCPIIAFIIQCLYVAFIIIRSVIIKNQAGRIIYPYFFLNLQTLGVASFFKWMLVMFAFTFGFGYLLILINKFVFAKKQKSHQQIADEKC